MPATFPCPKIPNTPEKNISSSPSRSTYCDARKRMSAWAMVRRVVPLIASRSCDRSSLRAREQLVDLGDRGHRVGAREPRRDDRAGGVRERERPRELPLREHPMRDRAAERVARAESAHDLDADARHV